MSRDNTILALSAALLLAGCSQAAASTATRPQEPAPASTPVKGPDPAGPSRTVLFMDWTSVYPGRVLPRIDPKRVTESGAKLLADLENSWKMTFSTGEGLEAFWVPRGVRITVEKARKSRPWLVADKPWEESVSWVTVIHEGDMYRAWYGARLAKEKEDIVVQQGRAMTLSGTALCYAESTDGVTWTKPNRGLISFNGSTENNMLMVRNVGGAVFRDDHAPAEERYKTFEFAKLPESEIKPGSGPSGQYGLYGLVSPDGYRWERLSMPLIRHFCDTQNIGAWDSRLKRYVGYFRDHADGRAISRGETEDFRSWPPPQTLLRRGSEDPPGTDYYTNCFTIYPGMPSLRLLFPAVYHQDRDRVDVRLAMSHDGRTFNWVSHEPIIELGRLGQWDGGAIYASPNLVRLGDGRLALPASFHEGMHNEAYLVGIYSSPGKPIRIGWATWDDGRLAGIESDDGEFYTKAFKLEGPLEINARAAAGGSVAIELCREGKPIEGFELSRSVPLRGDHVWVAPSWQGGADASGLAGQRLQLRFRLHQAKVFGYRMAGVERSNPKSAAAGSGAETTAPATAPAQAPTTEPSARPAKPRQKSKVIVPTTQPAPAPRGGFSRITAHGMMLHVPATQPAGTKNPVAYELGQIFQLDRDHCLLVASMDEQGGPDLCVGNDAFVFSKLSDIRPDAAIVINRGEPNYNWPGLDKAVYLAKYPVTGFFVPLGARLPDGRNHPGAGTGILISSCLAFDANRTDPIGSGKSGPSEKKWLAVNEVIQLRWDGRKLAITGVEKQPQVAGQAVNDKPFSQLVPQDKGFIGPFGQNGGGLAVVRYDWNGAAWAPTRIGKSFTTLPGEGEATIVRDGGRYLITTRRRDVIGRMYESADGFDYRPLCQWPNVDTPRSLNQGLDGSLYLATNPSTGWLRNPLVAYPWVGTAFGEGVVIHDQDGVRDDDGDKLPFIDHGLGVNVFLEGRWRHLLCYRVCDLKERTLYGFQAGMLRKIHGDSGPIPKRPTSGVYVAEMEYDKVTSTPWMFGP